jgi:hypothetical protein
VALGAWFQHRTSHGLIQEFTISVDGRAAGHILNQVLPEPRPRVAVVAAGGIAIGYAGPVADLMGLNWVDMAHAKHASGGFRGHLGFNQDVFWRALPEVVLLDQLPRTAPPKNSAPVTTSFYNRVLHGLPSSEQFRQAYEPGVVHHDGRYLWAYFLRDWIRQHDVDGYVRIGP